MDSSDSAIRLERFVCTSRLTCPFPYIQIRVQLQLANFKDNPRSNEWHGYWGPHVFIYPLMPLKYFTYNTSVHVVMENTIIMIIVAINECRRGKIPGGIDKENANVCGLVHRPDSEGNSWSMTLP